MLLQWPLRLLTRSVTICKILSNHMDISHATSSMQMKLDYSMRKFSPLNGDKSLTSLTSMPPDRGLSDKHQSGVKGSKIRLTFLFTTNADGSQKLPPMIIGKAYKPCPFKGKTGSQLSFYY